MPPEDVNRRGVAFRALLCVLAVGLALSSRHLARAGSSPQSTAQPGSPTTPVAQNPPEMSSQESRTTFEVNVRLVEVHVVVRDAQGKAIGALRKEDFHLFDDGKPQIITKFSLEKAGPVSRPEATSPDSSPSLSTPSAPAPDVPQ